MNKKDLLKKYAVKFAAGLKPRLRGDIHADMVIYPTNANGAVVEVMLVQAKPAGGKQRQRKGLSFAAESPSVNSVLENIQQHFVGGSLDRVVFSGTNISLENNRILLIKGDDQHWSESDAVADLSRVFDARRA